VVCYVNFFSSAEFPPLLSFCLVEEIPFSRFFLFRFHSRRAVQQGRDASLMLKKIFFSLPGPSCSPFSPLPSHSSFFFPSLVLESQLIWYYSHSLRDRPAHLRVGNSPTAQSVAVYPFPPHIPLSAAFFSGWVDFGSPKHGERLSAAGSD